MPYDITDGAQTHRLLIHDIKIYGQSQTDSLLQSGLGRDIEILFRYLWKDNSGLGLRMGIKFNKRQFIRQLLYL